MHEPLAVSGAARLANLADAALIVSWLQDFEEEALASEMVRICSNAAASDPSCKIGSSGCNCP